jgi:hypothetical protein
MKRIFRYDDDGHVDGARLRSELWPPTGLLFIPQVTLAWRTMVERYRQDKLPIRPPELTGNPTSSHLVAKQEVLAKKIMNLA